MMAAIMKSETVTWIELGGGSELRLSLLKICEWRGRETVTRYILIEKTKTVS